MSVSSEYTDAAAGLRPILATVSTRAYLEQMWDRRAFAVAMPLEEVRASHQDTLLGNIWHLANPLLSVAVYYLVFGMILDASGRIDNYILWLTTGVFAYGLTSRSVLAGATSISANQGLMRAMRFPRALVPVSTVLGRLMTFGFELAVLLIVAVLTGAGVSMRLLALPLILGVHTALNLGGAFVAARLNDSYRDIQQLIPFLFRLLMYVSGVMFSVQTFVDGATDHQLLSRIIGLNPLVQILDLYRWVFMGNQIDVGRVAESVVISGLLLVFGFRYFHAQRTPIRPSVSPTQAPLSIRIDDVHIEYELFAERRAALRERFAKREGSGRRVVHAVKGVSFDVHEGEAVGIVGSNGSGKSTLLSAVAGLLAPSQGEILVSDEPKLMGVGATLIPSASGYRNIRLGCCALGMTADEVDDRIDELVEFTDLGEAIERPLKTYSSGMRARLHFRSPHR